MFHSTKPNTYLCVSIQTKLTIFLLSMLAAAVYTYTHRDRQRDTVVASNVDLHGYGSDRECKVFPLSIFTGSEGERREREELLEIPK